MTVSALLASKEETAISPESLRTVAAESYKSHAPEQEPPAVPPVTKRVLDNGITLIVKEIHSNPTVAIYAAFPGGLRYEKHSKNGVGNFTVSMLSRGTKTRSREEIAKEVEGMAGGLSGFSGWNSTGASGKFLSRHFEPGLELLGRYNNEPDLRAERG